MPLLFPSSLYGLARPFLFGFDPEHAHELTLDGLARTQNTPLACAYAASRVDDPVTLAGLTFPNRVGLAAGLDKNARCIDAFAAMGFGFVEVGTVTPKGQPGNAKPRMFRLPAREALATRHNKRSPLFVKIAPDLDETQVAVIAATLQRHRMDGVIATNTTLARDAVAGLPHAEEAGGLSGAPVREASNRVVAQLRAALGKSFPIIGVGGILSAADAKAKIAAGADVVQIYTGLIYRGPALVREAAQALLRDRSKA